MVLICENCKKEFSFTPYRKNPNYKKKTCGVVCAAEATQSKIYTPERNKKVSISKMGSRNPQWRGDRVGYNALHTWVKRHLPKPDSCEDCLAKKPIDLANISQEYKRDLRDWEWLCRTCHMSKDGRLEKFIYNGANLPRDWHGRKMKKPL